MSYELIRNVRGVPKPVEIAIENVIEVVHAERDRKVAIASAAAMIAGARVVLNEVLLRGEDVDAFARELALLMHRSMPLVRRVDQSMAELIRGRSDEPDDTYVDRGRHYPAEVSE